jgi:hypothetical protein
MGAALIARSAAQIKQSEMGRGRRKIARKSRENQPATERP